MGIYDRDYTHDNYRGSGSGGMRIGSMFQPPTYIVKWLLIINFAIFIPMFMIEGLGNGIPQIFAVSTETVGTSLQIWRIITYQFLHDTLDLWHILNNMIILYCFGPMVEHVWGSKKFLKFYLICGAAGGLLYTLLANIGLMPLGMLVGASGAIFGVLAAAALLFPRRLVYIMGLIPITIWLLAVIAGVVSFLFMMKGVNTGGQLAHLAGMAVGVAYVLWKPWQQKIKINTQQGAWERKVQNEKNFHTEVDRILGKVQAQGINSLTRKEKQILQQATKREQQNG